MAKLIVSVAAIAAIIAFAATRRQKTGVYFGIPFDWRWPTLDVLRERIWNPADPHVLTPHVFGWGWSVNLPSAWRRVRTLAAR